MQQLGQHGDFVASIGQADHGKRRTRQFLAPSKGIRLPLQLVDHTETKNYSPRSVQACSPCDTDFLNFENRLKDTSPAGHFERTQKDPRDSFSSTGSLPDLD